MSGHWCVWCTLCVLCCKLLVHCCGAGRLGAEGVASPFSVPGYVAHTHSLSPPLPPGSAGAAGAAGAVDWMDGVEHHQTCTAEPLQQHTAGISTRRRLPSTLLSIDRGCKTSSTCPPSSQAASGSLAFGSGRSLHGATGHARPHSHTPLSAPPSLPLLVFQGGIT